jgi:PAS domain S-box-containing protein
MKTVLPKNQPVRLAAAVEQAAEAIAITGPSGLITYANRAFEGLVGLPVASLKGWVLSDLLEHPETGKAVFQASCGHAWAGRIPLRKAGGDLREIEATFSPVRDEEGEVVHILGTMRDVTREAERERALRQTQKMDALEALAAGVAHEFTSLLTTISTAAQLIKWNLPEDHPLQSKVDAILQAGLCADGLNKQILSFGLKIESKRLPSDLSVILRKVLHMLQATLPAKIKIKTEVTSGVWVEGDPAQLHQVILNLGLNAFDAMHTHGGALYVSLSERLIEECPPAVDLPEGRYAVLTVLDTGHGMDAKTQERIFEPFFTPHALTEGSGLRLSMVHATVAKMGGQIAVFSEPGKGTVFHVYLPCLTGRELPRTEELPQDLGGAESILFVDNEELVASLAKMGLQSMGYRVTTCTSSLKALEEFAAHPETYDLVFTDLAMPDLNGADLASMMQEIRPGIPIVLASGLPLAAALSLNVRASFQGVVSKPFTPFDLATAIRKTLVAKGKPIPREEESVTINSEQKGTPRKSALILLAEDSRTTRAMVKSWLEKEGYEVREAHDGLEAWELFNEGPDSGSFSLLLTDVVMPRMDGLELAQLVRKADPAIPIAVLTSNEDKETVKTALHLGVNKFLNKPFETMALLECVKGLLEERSSRLAARRSVETAQAVRLAQQSMVAVPEKDLPLYSLYEPLSDAGGDVFRCTKCAQGSIFFILADVAGHSVVSSYAVASFLATLSVYAGECMSPMAPQSLHGPGEPESRRLNACGHYGTIPCDPLRHLALKLNQGIQNGPFSEVPVCALLGLWTPGTGRLHLLNAGIPHGLLGHGREPSATPIAINGTPLGIFSEPMLEECILPLLPGDRLLFGTDGFFDVMSSRKVPFQDLASSQWEALRESPIDQALSRICEAARHHGDGVIPDDLLVVGFEQAAWEQAPEDLLFKLPSTPKSIDLICERLTGCLASLELGLNLSAQRRFDIVLAVREALTNAVLHGNANRPEAMVTLRCQPGAERETLTIIVADEGGGFDLEAHAPPSDPLSERGRGIPLIRAFAQDLRMTGGELTMTFHL